MATLRLKIADRHIVSANDFAALMAELNRKAHDRLPNLVIGTSRLDFGPDGAYLLVKVDLNVAVEL